MSECSRDREEGALKGLASVCINGDPMYQGEKTERASDFWYVLGLEGHVELRVPILYTLQFICLRDF